MESEDIYFTLFCKLWNLKISNLPYFQRINSRFLKPDNITESVIFPFLLESTNMNPFGLKNNGELLTLSYAHVAWYEYTCSLH